MGKGKGGGQRKRAVRREVSMGRQEGRQEVMEEGRKKGGVEGRHVGKAEGSALVS